MKRWISLVTAVAMLTGLLSVGLPSGHSNRVQAAPAEGESIKIPLSLTKVVNQSNYGDPSRLVDEQTSAGDPRGGTGGNAYSYWYGAWVPATPTQNYPIYAYIDLGQPYQLTDIYLLSVVENEVFSDFKMYSGTPEGGEWSLLIENTLNATPGWKAFDVEDQEVTTRYVRVEMSSFDAKVSELVLYGVPVPAKLNLTPAMVTNESGYGDATRLVDEQTMAGNPKAGSGGAPNRFWFGAWEDPYQSTSTSYPAYAYMDLGATYRLSDIYLYDFNDPGTWDDYESAFNVYTGSPGNWTLAYAAVHTGSNTWINQNLNDVETRYVRVENTRLSAVMSEIVLYGSPITAVSPPKIPLNISMVSGEAEAYKIVDNQNTVGDPLHSPVSVNWGSLSSWNVWNGNADINLGQSYRIESIFLGDYGGSGPVKVFAGNGNPVVWTELYSTALNGYESWTKQSVSATAEHIRIQKLGGGDIPEVVMYGTPVPKPILLMDSMLNNVSGFAAVEELVNQQALIGDPLHGSSSLSGNVDEVVASNITTTSYPAEAYIDLGHPYEITNIALLDGNDIADSGDGVSVYAGNPDSWGDPLFTDRMLNRAAWNTHPVSVTTQYIRVIKSSGKANFSEIAIYGTRVGGAMADEIAPAAVFNLSVAAQSSNSVTLRWTAPGDSGTAGTAASYSIRYSETPITDGNWNLATPVDNAPAPLAAGSQQTFQVSGLTAETNYYFALKTKDAVGNESLLSNVLQASTLAVDVTAPSAIQDLASTFVSGNGVRLSWTATGDDAAVGTADSYEILYSTEPVTINNLGAARLASWTPEPTKAGSEQAAWVYDLEPETSYYFAIRVRDEADNWSMLSNVVEIATKNLTVGGLLQLTKDMIINETAHGDASKLVDQQEGIDPRASVNGTFNVDDPSERWDLGSNALYLPASAVIDFGVEVELSDIYLYDGNGGSGSLRLSVGDPFNWQPVATDTLDNWKQWNHHRMNVTARYLQIYRPTNADVLEIAVYGTPLGEAAALPEAVTHAFPAMNDLIGINAFIDDPLDKMAVAGFVREYHNWNWDEGDLWNWGAIQSGYDAYPNNKNKFNPSYAGGGWNFDQYYSNLAGAGITVAPNIKESVGWLSAAANNKPVSADENPLDPNSYAEHADHFFQYAARYGSEEVADNRLKLADDQPRLTGAGLLEYYENWNEQNKWWEGRNSYYSPYEYAAMTSADYDGHLGTMGDTFGVKNADPNAKLVMGGMANPAEDAGMGWSEEAHPMLEYTKALKFWSDWNRGGDVPFDVINIHHYSLSSSTGTGISPEADRFEEKLGAYVDYRNRYMPGKEVWITEFGYDTHPESPGRAPAIGGNSAEEVQGQWLVRGYLAAAAAGIDKAAMYMLRDVDANSATRFNTSGLTGSKETGWAPKLSWYYVYTLKNRLAGLSFENKLETGNEDVLVYKFADEEGTKEVYAVWASTSSDMKIDDFEITLDGAPVQATLITMTEGDTDGVESTLDVRNGKVQVDVSERPIFIQVESVKSSVITTPDSSVQTIAYKNDSIELTVKPDVSGYASFVLTAQELEQLLRKGAEKIHLVLKALDGSALKTATIRLPSAAVAKAAANGASLVIDGGVASVTIKANDLTALIGHQTSPFDIRIGIVNSSELTESARRLIGYHPIIETDLSLDGKDISNPEVPMTIDIPYSPATGEASHNLIVYRVADDGSLSVVKNGLFDSSSGTIRFTAAAPGRFAVAYRPVIFKDLEKAVWAKIGIEALAARGIVSGKGESSFDPAGTVTRAEFVTLLIRALDLQTDDADNSISQQQSGFTDVDEGQWYSDAINQAVEIGIVQGRGDGTFGIDQNITRQEMALIIQRALRIQTTQRSVGGFSDTDKLAEEAKLAIAALAEAGLLNGFDDGSFRPEKGATRVQAAIVIYRILMRL